MPPLPGSHALMLHANAMLCADLRQWLEPYGWICECCGLGHDLVISQKHPPAIILIDGSIDPTRRQELVTMIRAMAGPAGGTPTLLIASTDDTEQKGVSGRIDLPLQRDRAIPVIEQWTGPLGDHAFRDPSEPHYRLVRLAGRDTAERLLLSFANHAEEALAQLDAGTDVTRVAHDIAGLAGTMGFAGLSDLWSAIERNESPDPQAAREATRAVIDRLRRLFAQL